MKAKLLKELDVSPRAKNAQIKTVDGRRVWPVDSIIDDPKAYRLVQMGVAEPADDECRKRAAMSPDEMKKAQSHQEMVAKGIQPEDYERYQDGEILGYDEEGNDIPGPNWNESTEKA